MSTHALISFYAAGYVPAYIMFKRVCLDYRKREYQSKQMQRWTKGDRLGGLFLALLNWPVVLICVFILLIRNFKSDDEASW